MQLVSYELGFDLEIPFYYCQALKYKKDALFTKIRMRIAIMQIV